MEPSSTQQDLLSAENIDRSEKVNFVRDSVAAQLFSEYLANTDTDEDNSGLAPSRRYVWYCKLRTCPKYYTAWSCKTNFLLHLHETPVHRHDPTTSTRKGRRQFSRSWREEAAYKLGESHFTYRKQPSVELVSQTVGVITITKY